LGRLTKADFDPDAVSVRLQDAKGRRKTPRQHFVPLVPEAKAALDAMQGGTAGPYLFTVTAGATGAVYSTLQTRLRDVVAEMLEADEASAPFTAGDLRRTVETRLAALGVSAETRAQLQSHGLGGVQARHYDRHDYDQEKRAALTQLFELITRKAGTVVPLKRAKGAARKK
jgi:integrase